MTRSSNNRRRHLFIWALAMRHIHALQQQQQQLTTPSSQVVVVGGTHGNEYTGIWCIQHLQTQTQELQIRYPSLSISTVLGNPVAFQKNRRFIDTDLNRECSIHRLRDHQQSSSTSSSSHHHSAATVTGVEAQRARQLERMFCAPSKEFPSTDIIIDLHTTTANMGVTVIVPENDPFMIRAAAYVVGKLKQQQQQSNDKNNAITDFKSQILLYAVADRLQRPNLSSLARHGFTIEVGPVPQSVVRHDRVCDTLNCLHHLLDFLNHHYHHQHYTTTKENTITSHKSDHHHVLLRDLYPKSIVPCFRSVRSKCSEKRVLGKIAWPTDSQSSHFPKWMVHEDWQDQDFLRMIRVGDPLFVSIAGEIIRYDGSHGDSAYLMFINEGGYYYAQSGTGIGVAEVLQYHMGWERFLEEDNKDDGDDSPQV
jgi:succinylglutamate desuccinylase